MNTLPFIHAEHLRYAYKNTDEQADTPALFDVSVDINKGEYVAVLGHNGSGKSTFAKLLSMLLTPTGGVLTVDGADYTNPDTDEKTVLEQRKKVGMVFQNPDNQIVASIVEEDVAFGPENIGIEQKELQKRVDEALAAVNMTEYRFSEPARLSGGQKQRVAIAGILAMRPTCIVFDESTAMLDPAGRRDVLDIMKKLNRDEGITVIHITHYMEEAAEADRIIVIHDGRNVLDGTPDEVFKEKRMLDVCGLAVPQCATVMHALQEKGIALGTSAYATPDAVAKAILSAYREVRRD